NFAAIAHRLLLVRIPLDKHEIARAKRMPPDAQFSRWPPVEGEQPFQMRPDEPYIIPRAIGGNGAMEWFALDTSTMNSLWINRRQLSDEIVALADTIGLGTE